jgi:hypothetical protein
MGRRAQQKRSARVKLDSHGQRIRACVDRARVARQRANDLERTARQELNEAENICAANGISFKHWCERHTGLTYREAQALGWRVQYERKN